GTGRGWQSGFLRAGDATAEDDDPEARVYPAPRSQIRMSTWERPATRANWTLVRLGKAGWRSIRGPSVLQRSSSSLSTKTTQCGLPTDTAVTVSVSVPT